MVYVEGAWISGQDLKPGDQFRAVGPVQVAGEKSGGVLHAKPGNYHYVGSPGSKSRGDSQFVLIKKAVTLPACWPPQEGDVWRSAFGNEYHVLGKLVRSHNDISFPLSHWRTDVERAGGDHYTLAYRKQAR